MSLTPAARTYLTAVITAGAAALAWSARDLVVNPPTNPYWLILLALTVFSSTFSIRIPNVSITISVSETFVFLCALLYGGSPATVIIAIDGLVTSILRHHRHPLQLAFNATEPALSLFAAAAVFRLAAGHDIAGPTPAHVGDGFLPLAGFTLTYFLLNSGLNAGIVATLQGTSWWRILRSHFGTVLLHSCGSASVAGLLVYNSHDFSFTTLAIVLPLLVISYFTFKTSLQRVEDANQHLEQMNRLYLSTIETLAMAVDATDQITHGHIRRVQSWAIGLARALGVTDTNQLKAIEAAALLHDVGKLAIPEHILNKPGRLSPAEFEKMKKHASIGADILSAIDFPYPVVPIVRHHHEQWDGSGYPDGIRGADIPIGARILSVVDCFDALTSDRPYRRALSDEQALRMLLDGRGKAYDPLVVDTFARVYSEIAPVEPEHGARSDTLRKIAEVAHTEPVRRTTDVMLAQAGDEMLPVLGAMLAGSAFPGRRDLAGVAQALRSATPAALVAFYEHRDDSTLAVWLASGECEERLAGFTMAVGERLSGWVAANRRVVANSDASLDFVALDGPPLPFRSCLSVPVVSGDTLEGVITLYSRHPAAFSDRHRRTVESAVKAIGHLWRGIRELARVEQLAARQASVHLQPLDPAETPAAWRSGATVLWAAMDPARSPDERLAALVRAAQFARRLVGPQGGVHRDGSDALIVVMPRVDVQAMAAGAGRVRERMADDGAIATGIAAMPQDGRDLATVVEVARRRAKLSLCTPTPARDDEGPGFEQARLFDEGKPSRAGVA